MFYFIYLLIDFLPLTPRGCATALAEEYVPNLSHSAFGFKYQAAPVSNFAWVTFFLLVTMLNFVRYLEGNKHSGSQFDLHTHFRLVVVTRKNGLGREYIK